MNKQYIYAKRKGTILYNVEQYSLSKTINDVLKKAFPDAKISSKNKLIKQNDFVECELVNIENMQFLIVDNTVYLTIGSIDIYDNLDEVKKLQEKNVIECKYMLFLDGKPFKDKKYKKLSDVFSALMIEMGYYCLFETLANEKSYYEKNPELRNVFLPEWLMGGSSNLGNFALLEQLEVHKYFGAKVPTEKVETDYVEKIKWHFDNILIAMNYGLVTKDIFKKMEDVGDYDFKYLLVYSPKEYFNTNFYNFESLKEEDFIKEAFKTVKKTAMKVTKYGKTAMAFRMFDELEGVFRLFKDDEKNRCRMITLESDKRGCEITHSGSAVQEFRIQSLKEILSSI